MSNEGSAQIRFYLSGDQGSARERGFRRRRLRLSRARAGCEVGLARGELVVMWTLGSDLVERSGGVDLHRALRRLVAAARRHYGGGEYFAGFELYPTRTEGEDGHWHVLWRGPVMAHEWVRNKWIELTGSNAVRFDVVGGTGVARYVTKAAGYASKSGERRAAVSYGWMGPNNSEVWRLLREWRVSERWPAWRTYVGGGYVRIGDTWYHVSGATGGAWLGLGVAKAQTIAQDLEGLRNVSIGDSVGVTDQNNQEVG